MQFRSKVNASGQTVYSVICVYHYANGEKCSQKGVKLGEGFYEALYQGIIDIDEVKLRELRQKDESRFQTKALLQVKRLELEKANQALAKLLEAYEEGLISKGDFIERKSIRDSAKREYWEKLPNFNENLMIRVSK
jgi:uncharacterized Fe-S cluster-containing protein